MQHPRLELFLYLKSLSQKLTFESHNESVATLELMQWSYANGKGRIKFGWPSKLKKVKFSELQVLEQGKVPKLASEWMDDYIQACRMELDKVVRHLAKVDSSREKLRDTYQGSPLLPEDSNFLDQFSKKIVGPVLTIVQPIKEGYFIISEDSLRHLFKVMNFRL